MDLDDSISIVFVKEAVLYFLLLFAAVRGRKLTRKWRRIKVMAAPDVRTRTVNHVVVQHR